MAIANETTLGTVVLTGDLAGGNNATMPQLVPTGVKAGEYKAPTVTVDAKGRLLFARNLSYVDVSCADVGECGIVKVGNNITATTTGGRTVLSLKKASATDYGVVRLGNGFAKGCCEIYVDYPVATITTKGSVIVPASGNLLIDVDSKISVPLGTTSVKGLISVPTSNGLSITAGTVSFNGAAATYPNATISTKGVVSIPTNNGLTVTAGTMSFNGAAATYPDATISVKGVVQVGANINVSSGLISVPTATTSVAGVFRGDSLFTNSGGLLSWQNIASVGTRGFVRVGSGLGIDANGVLSRGASGGDATTSSKGIVQIATASGLSVTGGVVSTVTATTGVKGVARGDGTFAHSGGVLDQTTISTASVLGLVKVGTGLSIDGTGLLTRTGVANDATTFSKGVVQIGSGLGVSSGVVSLTTGNATTGAAGIVQPGTGLNVDGSGVLSMTLADSSTSTPGVIWNYGNNAATDPIKINNGVVSFDPTPLATLGDNVFTGVNGPSLYEAANAPSNAGTVTMNLANGQAQSIINMPLNLTLGSPLNITSGTLYTFVVTYTNAGRNLSFGSAWKFPTGTTLPFVTTGTNQAIVIRAIGMGSSLYCFSIS